VSSVVGRTIAAEASVKRFTRILTATDFSDHGNAAVEAAFALCHDAATTVFITHIVDAPPTPNPLYAHYYPSKLWDRDALIQAEAEARKELGKLIPEQVANSGIAVELVLGHGQPVPEILRIAEEKQADIIVIGTHGRTGLTSLILGSVVDKVLHVATVPVLVAR
jgi:universal stress protein A